MINFYQDPIFGSQYEFQPEYLLPKSVGVIAVLSDNKVYTAGIDPYDVKPRNKNILRANKRDKV